MAAKTPKFRGSYAFLLEPSVNTDGQKQYRVRADFDANLFNDYDPTKPETVPEWARAAVLEAIEQGKAKLWSGKVPKGLQLPFYDGEQSDLDGMDGLFYMNLKQDAKYPIKVFIKEPGKPSVLIDDAPIDNPHEAIYSGAYYRAIVRFYPYKNQSNVGIGVGLDSIVKVADGERLSGGISTKQAASMFDDDDDSNDEDIF